MANPQLEHGYVRIANRLDEAITFAPFSGTQTKLVRAILRLSYGWRQKTVRLSLADLTARIGIAVPRDGRAPGHVRRAMAELVAAGVVIEVEKGTGKRPGAIAIRKNFAMWGKFAVDPAALEQLFTPRPGHADEQLPAALAAELQPDLFSMVESVHDAEADRGVVGPSEDQQKQEPVSVVGPQEDQQAVTPDSVVGPSEDQQENVDKSSWSSQGHLVGPLEDQQTDANAADHNDLRLRKDMKDRTTTTPDAPPRAHAREGLGRETAGGEGSAVKNPVVGRIGGDVGRFALSLTVLANQAITDRWGAQPAPLVASSGHAYEAAQQLLDAGVDLAEAAFSIGDQVKRSSQARPPRSLKYFAPGILDWHDAQLRVAAAAGVTADAVRAPTSPPGRRDRGRREPPQQFNYPNATKSPESAPWQD